MSRNIILPAGISVLRGLERHKVCLTPGHEAAQLTAGLLKSLGDAADDLSAELSTLSALHASAADEAVFLATDTDDGERAARINALIAERRYQVGTTISRVRSLGLDDATEFRKEGLPSLVRELDRFVEKATDHRREPLLSVSGGIKPVVPYIAVYGMLRRVPVTYVFEMTRTLITLPPLPIDFDWAGLQSAERVLHGIEQEVAIERSRLEALLSEDFQRLEGLFEDLGSGQMTLSAFGLMLLEDLKRARESPVMLSPSAHRKLGQRHAIDRKQMEFMLDRVRSPLWRAQKHHSFHGTDLNVYKPGSTGHRLAGWVEGERVYVAELYTSHDEYVSHLPSRLRKHYNPGDFTSYWPIDTEPDLHEEEVAGDKMIAIAIRDKEQAERDRATVEAERDKALEMAVQTEEALNERGKEAEELRRRMNELEAEQGGRDSWGLWRRLRWALFGS